MKVIALLPMKAHSERVPNKNMRDFCGHPLYHAMMKSLLSSHNIEKIVINTDSLAIREDVLKHFPDRVDVHERPEQIRGDMVSMNDVISNDLERTQGEYYLQTHSTNPLLSTDAIDHAVDRYCKALKEGYDSLFSVTRLQTRLYDRNGMPINHDPDKLERTQDLPPVYEENSCLYLFSRSSFALSARRIGSKPLMFEIPREEAVDIDEESDFRIAECLFNLRKSEKIKA